MPLAVVLDEAGRHFGLGQIIAGIAFGTRYADSATGAGTLPVAPKAGPDGLRKPIERHGTARTAPSQQILQSLEHAVHVVRLKVLIIWPEMLVDEPGLSRGDLVTLYRVGLHVIRAGVKNWPTAGLGPQRTT